MIASHDCVLRLHPTTLSHVWPFYLVTDCSWLSGACISQYSAGACASEVFLYFVCCVKLAIEVRGAGYCWSRHLDMDWGRAQLNISKTQMWLCQE